MYIEIISNIFVLVYFGIFVNSINKNKNDIEEQGRRDLEAKEALPQAPRK